jgi:hypothetical protein
MAWVSPVVRPDPPAGRVRRVIAGDKPRHVTASATPATPPSGRELEEALPDSPISAAGANDGSSTGTGAFTGRASKPTATTITAAADDLPA